MWAVGILGACTSTIPRASESTFEPLWKELTTAGLPLLSSAEQSCAVAEIDLDVDVAGKFVSDISSERNYATANRVAAAYVACGDLTAQRESITAGIEDLSAVQADARALCISDLDGETLAAAVAAVLITDEQRLYRSLSEFVYCVRRVTLSETLEGRVYLAFSTTSLAPVVRTEVASCAAKTLESSSDIAAVEDVLAGAIGSPSAVSEISAALVPCVDQTDLAAVVAVSTGIDEACGAAVVENDELLVVSLIAAYISQDGSTADSLIEAIRSRC